MTSLAVVGGTSGIGRAIATIATERNHDVVVMARRTGVDVRDEPAVAAAFADLDSVDAVVYAAGVAQLAALRDQSLDAWRATLETNLVGAATVAKHATPRLAERGGVLLFVSSTTSDEHRWGLGAYGVSKAALNRLVDGLREEHPEVRFVRATLGPTSDTDFAADFDHALLGDAFNRWVDAGQHTVNQMPVDGLADVVVSLIESLLEHPDVDMPSVHLEPPGGRFTRSPAPRADRG